MTAKETVSNFIEEIWNKNQFKKLDDFLHPAFKDNSLPPDFPANRDGLMLWVLGTGKSFEHKTVVEEIVSEEEKVIVKIKMNMKHIGDWRNIKPTGLDISTIGYRYFKLKDNRIIEHWALIDGTAIETQLGKENHACKIPE